MFWFCDVNFVDDDIYCFIIDIILKLWRVDKININIFFVIEIVYFGWLGCFVLEISYDYFVYFLNFEFLVFDIV